MRKLKFGELLLAQQVLDTKLFCIFVIALVFLCCAITVVQYFRSFEWWKSVLRKCPKDIQVWYKVLYSSAMTALVM